MEITRKLDHARKLEIVTMTDKHGAVHILQHPLLLAGYDKEAREREEIEMLEANELAWDKVISASLPK
jgi:hypothetical protein